MYTPFIVGITALILLMAIAIITSSQYQQKQNTAGHSSSEPSSVIPPAQSPPVQQPSTSLPVAEPVQQSQSAPTVTVAQALRQRCPVDPAANGKITLGNAASYEDYLFSACKEADICDGPQENADPISKYILATMPSIYGCGAWKIGKYQWDWNNNRWQVE